MKDVSRAWQKHFKHSVLCFSWGARSKSLFSFMLSCSSHTSSHQLQHTGSQKPFPAFGEKGLSTCLSPPWNFTLIHLRWNVRSVPHTKPLLPSNSRVPFPRVPPLAEDQWNPLRLSSYLLPAWLLKYCTDSFPEVTFLLVKKTES